MTYRVGDQIVIEPEHPKKCVRCGQEKECRDVLGDGKQMCFGCATPEEREAYGRRLFGVEEGGSP